MRARAAVIPQYARRLWSALVGAGLRIEVTFRRFHTRVGRCVRTVVRAMAHPPPMRNHGRQVIVEVLMKKTAALLAVTVSGIALPNVAHATPLFVGSYTAVEDSPSAARPETPGTQPDQSGIWNVQSSCLTLGCLAHVVISKSQTDFDMVFDGTKWDRLAVAQVGMCNGATVAARSAHEILLPQANGSLTGTITSTVDCNGTSVNLSQPLIVTPF